MCWGARRDSLSVLRYAGLPAATSLSDLARTSPAGKTVCGIIRAIHGFVGSSVPPQAHAGGPCIYLETCATMIPTWTKRAELRENDASLRHEKTIRIDIQEKGKTYGTSRHGRSQPLPGLQRTPRCQQQGARSTPTFRKSSSLLKQNKLNEAGWMLFRKQPADHRPAAPGLQPRKAV